MLKFQKITLAEKALVESFTCKSERRNCDLSFINIFGWSTHYHTEYALYKNFLLFRFQTNGHLAYMFPLGEGDLIEVIEEMLRDAVNEHRPFLLLGVCSQTIEILEAAMPDRFIFTSDRDYADYIYPREQLETLAGKKLQAKRNHVNRFIRSYPNYQFLPLTADLVPQCIELYDKWRLQTSSQNEEGAEAERNYLNRVLNSMEQLNLLGGVLFVDDKLVAFTYGGAINYDTFDVCVEKADITYTGAYPTINQLFAASLPSNFVHINREEDLGIEGLRKAKLSYYPSKILEKHSIREKRTQKEELNTTLKKQTQALWECCFNDTKEFVNLYFETKYSDDINVYRQREDKVVAAMQRVPYQLTFNEDLIAVNYLSGVCTHPEYRNQGIMTELLEEAHQKMYQQSVVFSLLIPAEPWLFDYYAKTGYRTLIHLGISEIAPQNSNSAVITSKWNTVENEEEIYTFFALQMRNRNYAIQHSLADFRTVVADLQLANGMIYLSRDFDNSLSAISFGVKRNDAWHILELLSVSDGVKSSHLAHIENDTHLPLMLYRTMRNGDNISVQPFGQLRVTHVETALRYYALANPTLDCTIEVYGDNHVAQNNGYYQLRNGECLSTTQASNSCDMSVRRFSIGELTDFLFCDANPTMSLMLN